MNFFQEQEPKQSPAADEAPDLGSTDATFVTSDGAGAAGKKPQSQQAMVLAGLVVVAAAVVYFMYFRGGPQTAAAAEAGPGADTVSTFLASGEEHMQLMKQMLQNTDKVVQRFRTYPAQTQVPLASLQTNPFRQLAPKAKGEPESEAAARRRRDEERQAAEAAVAGLRLQSVVKGGRFPACMVNNKLYAAGSVVDGFTIEQINAGTIVVRNGPFRFEVGMAK